MADANKKTSLSFEVFPPKKEEEFENIFTFLREVAKLSPDFISCTYGAGGSRAGKTIEIASFIQKELKIDAIAHITCVGFTRADLTENCEALEAAGVTHVLALRGDRPQHMTDEQFDSREFFYATDLVRYLKKHTSLQISGACYPEKHFESPSLDEDLKHLKEKVDAGVTSLVTQMFFNNDCYYRFMEKVRAMGITVPVHAGIMPITTAKQLGTTVSLSGSSVPKELADIIAAYGDDKEDMRKAGIDYAVRQILDLKKNGVDGIHIYSMNKLKTTTEICAQIS
ncbi:MAG: methylenetetrahydrofolate reductase [NAD(P)H] [Bacteroidales bacterium]|nr:methylenetetrahydrofolate reductase [NAD(P)H] [Bacteroidales bacterium]MCM1416410.1 methylenetetrahydrofolate reductase [NAD(P)H] [bacterium]MCM1424059.1 methylenetetrahydrofolate reductase [NAD(P)H] [bacterium]